MPVVRGYDHTEEMPDADDSAIMYLMERLPHIGDPAAQILFIRGYAEALGFYEISDGKQIPDHSVVNGRRSLAEYMSRRLRELGAEDEAERLIEPLRESSAIADSFSGD